MYRRTVLRGSAAGGCVSYEANSSLGVILTHVELGNWTRTSQQFNMLVLHDERIVHWDVHEVDGGTDDEAGGEVIPMKRPGEPGRVEVLVRVGEHWERTDFADGSFAGDG